jgi:hypothetical protein
VKPLPITPGPWFWFADHPSDSCADVRGLGGREVCVLYGRADTEQRNANAALIAASRALLAFAECHAALDMPTDQGYAILERHGLPRDYPLAPSEFVKLLRDNAIRKTQMGPSCPMLREGDDA